MFESIINFFKNIGKKEQETVKSKDAAKERLHLVLMQDRANVSADFLDLMKQEIIEVIKKYIDVDENSIDVRLTNKTNGDGTTGAPALYANIPIVSIKEDVKSKISRENDPKAQHIIPDNKEEEKEEIKQTEEDNNQTSEEQSSNEKNEEEVKTEDTIEQEENKHEEDNSEQIVDNKEEANVTQQIGENIEQSLEQNDNEEEIQNQNDNKEELKNKIEENI